MFLRGYDVWKTTEPVAEEAPEPVCATCGDPLRPGEPRECAECEGDRLAATPCATGCGRLCDDREPPMSAAGPLCSFCYHATL